MENHLDQSVFTYDINKFSAVISVLDDIFVSIKNLISGQFWKKNLRILWEGFTTTFLPDRAIFRRYQLHLYNASSLWKFAGHLDYFFGWAKIFPEVIEHKWSILSCWDYSPTGILNYELPVLLDSLISPLKPNMSENWAASYCIGFIPELKLFQIVQRELNIEGQANWYPPVAGWRQLVVI